MIPFILKLQRHANTLLDRLTADRASRLDEITSTRMARLNADISSRAASSDVATLLERLTNTRAGYLDAAISSVRGVKSIQSGFLNSASTTTGTGEDTRYVDTTISAVVVANSEVFLQLNNNSFSARLTSTTNIRVGSLSTPATISTRWWVIEYA